MDIATVTWLALGFGLGLVHAFDADHVMALSVFSARGRGASEGVRAGIRWSLGHGLTLVAVGLGLLVLGRAMPAAFITMAERGVGFVMIALGVWVFIDLARQRAHLHFHEHDDLPPHAHWHTHDGERNHGHEHAPLLVGGLHGLAGSAPILAVLPAAARSPILGFTYLVVFAVGVCFAMAIVSGVLGHVAGRLRDGRGRRLALLRASSAAGSIVLGIWMIAIG